MWFGLSLFNVIIWVWGTFSKAGIWKPECIGMLHFLPFAITKDQISNKQATTKDTTETINLDWVHFNEELHGGGDIANTQAKAKVTHLKKMKQLKKI
jgi:hypothetical protein